MVTLQNPALREEPLSQKPHIIPPRENESLLNWLEGTGRFKAYEIGELHYDEVAAELEEIIGASIYDSEKEEEEEDWDVED
ncbi:MAG: DUF3134 family protein [Leptolyngbyaceae cyanobacterium CRU_2_3]|nr:DUF3134 family protein [Leptolyngbyaceae cyanobacterium CRU_2_3]